VQYQSVFSKVVILFHNFLVRYELALMSDIKNGAFLLGNLNLSDHNSLGLLGGSCELPFFQTGIKEGVLKICIAELFLI
jgi:hypothetical protein